MISWHFKSIVPASTLDAHHVCGLLECALTLYANCLRLMPPQRMDQIATLKRRCQHWIRTLRIWQANLWWTCEWGIGDIWIFEISGIWHSGHDRRIVRQAVAWNRGIVITDVTLPQDLHSTWKPVALCSVAGAGWVSIWTLWYSSSGETEEANHPREPGSVVWSLNSPGCPDVTSDLWFVLLHMSPYLSKITAYLSM